MLDEKKLILQVDTFIRVILTTTHKGGWHKNIHLASYKWFLTFEVMSDYDVLTAYEICASL